MSAPEGVTWQTLHLVSRFRFAFALHLLAHQDVPHTLIEGQSARWSVVGASDERT